MLGSQEEILPGQSARVETTLEGAWPTGRISTTLRAFQDPVRDDPGLGQIEPTVVEDTTSAVPWPQLAVLALLLVTVVLLVRRRRRNKAALAAALEAARAEGAREAQDNPDDVREAQDKPDDAGTPASAKPG